MVGRAAQAGKRVWEEERAASNLRNAAVGRQSELAHPGSPGGMAWEGLASSSSRTNAAGPRLALVVGFDDAAPWDCF